ncbi:MAG: hypothetical protein QOF58_8217, partial [Pseudonocardiales bacterium]|nr:hypothetical protein [Pseudonocardiales bacterium]
DELEKAQMPVIVKSLLLRWSRRDFNVFTTP